MEIISLTGPDLQGKTPSKISDAKKNLLASFADEILLQINAHGSEDNHLKLLNENGEKISMPLPNIIKYLTHELSLEQKKKIKFDVLACHVGSNVQPTLKQSFESQTETVYEKELSTVLKNSGITLILNGGKYPTSGAINSRLIEESKGKEIEEILMARMLEPSTLKLAVNDGGENTQFIKFGAVKLKNIPADLSSEEKRKLIKDGLIQRINQMAEFLKTKNPEKAESIDKIKNNLIAEKLSETNYENFINKYLNDALIVEICKAERENIDQRIKNIKMLLEMGVDVNWQDINGVTPLHIATETGKAEIVQALIDSGADVDRPDHNGVMPLQIAAKNGHLDVVTTLVKAGADVNRPDNNGLTPLQIAAKNGHLDVVEELLVKAGADVNQQNNIGATAIFAAVQSGNSAILRFLIDSGANVDQQTNTGLTPIFIAAKNGNLNLVKDLIEAKAGLNQQINTGETAIFAAARNGKLDIVRLLVLRDADIDIKNNNGETPLFIAAKNGHSNVVKSLIIAACNVDIKTKDGTTPLDIAAKMGYSEILEILIKSKLKQLENQQTNPEVLSSSNTFFENVRRLLKDGQIQNDEVKKALSDGLAEFKKLNPVNEQEISEPDDIISAQNDEANSSQPTDLFANNQAEAVHPKNTTQNQKRTRVETAPSSDVERRTDREQKSLIRKLAGCFIPKSRE